MNAIKESLVCIGDGDNIGDTIDFYLLSDKLEDAGKFSLLVKKALEQIAESAQEQMDAHIVYIAGDDICFLAPKSRGILKYLDSYCKDFFMLTGRTISFGVGSNSVEATICLRKAKVSGKGKIVDLESWS